MSPTIRHFTTFRVESLRHGEWHFCSERYATHREAMGVLRTLARHNPRVGCRIIRIDEFTIDEEEVIG